MSNLYTRIRQVFKISTNLLLKLVFLETPILFSDYKKKKTHRNVNVVSTFQVQDIPNPRGRPRHMSRFSCLVSFFEVAWSKSYVMSQ